MRERCLPVAGPAEHLEQRDVGVTAARRDPDDPATGGIRGDGPKRQALAVLAAAAFGIRVRGKGKRR